MPPPSCAAYAVHCIAGTQPARGRVLPAVDVTLRTSDYCRSLWQPWLPPQLGDAAVLTSQASPCYPCPTSSLLPRRGEGADPLSACTDERYTVFQCSTQSLVPSSALAAGGGSGGVDVLLAHSDNAGHGLFAMVERIINQILYARASGLVPFVFIGEHIFAEGRACEHGTNPYHDGAHGENVWEYYFEQPSAYRAGEASVGRQRVRSVQVVNPQALYHLRLPGHVTQTYTGATAYDGPGLRRLRAAAHSVVGNGSLVRATILERARRLFAPWRAASAHILGMHVRGTDKVVAKKVLSTSTTTLALTLNTEPDSEVL